MNELLRAKANLRKLFISGQRIHVTQFTDERRVSRPGHQHVRRLVHTAARRGERQRRHENNAANNRRDKTERSHNENISRNLRRSRIARRSARGKHTNRDGTANR